MGRHLGLIIGVNQYQDGSFQQLRFAEHDARALAQWLVNIKGGQWSPSDVQLIQGQHATQELVESLIAQLCLQKAEPGDVVLFYFAGHAFVDDVTGEGYLSLFNSRYQDPTTSMSILSLTQQVLARSRATHIVCILDCFQNGQRWNTSGASLYDSSPLFSPSLLATLQQQPNRLFLCSCRGNKDALERSERNLGVMAHSAIIGLCGPARDPRTGTITLSGLYTYLLSVLGEQQRPQLFGEIQSPLVLVGDLPDSPDLLTPLSTRSLSDPLENVPVSAPLPSSTGTARLPAGGLLLKQNTFSEAATSQTMAPSQAPSAFTPTTTSTSREQHQQQKLQTLGQAQQAFQAQNYEQAFYLVELVLQFDPTDTSALTLKGQLLGIAGRFPEAGAVIDQLLQTNPNDAMAWSMRAVALTNMGNHQEALASIEHSLELDAQNPETYALKNTIMANIAFVQSQTHLRTQNKFIPAHERRSDSRAFAAGLGLHLLGLLIGFAGFALLILLHNLPAPAGLSLVSISLALLCVNAARGSFRYGFIHLLLALFLSFFAGGTIALAYKVGMSKIIAQLNLHPSLLVPLIFLSLWLAGVAVIPLLLALGGLIGGIISRIGKR